MSESLNPDKPPEGGSHEDPLDDLLQAAFDPDPLDVPCRQDSVLAILKTMTGSENRIRLQDISTHFLPPSDATSAEVSPNRSAADRYKILGEIARGGLGIVMKSQDTVLGRDVAMKMLQERFAFNPKMIRRLFEEAQIGGQLQHPGIVPIYEMGLQENQQPFFTMKLVNGQTLSALLKGRKNPGEDRMRFLRIFEQVCQTMAYAHARGVIHRDLKPSNIMVGSFGETQLMDWGLAKVIGQRANGNEVGAEADLHDDSSIETYRTVSGDRYSEAGSVMGTYGYMSPEQARGEGDRVGERSDVFGLGAILCVILTGKSPFTGEDPETIRQMAQEGKLDECWKRLEACVADARMKSLAQRCLAPRSEDRPRDAGVVAEEMETYLAEVAERAQRAELQSAESRVRAEEAVARVKQERRAKRLGFSLAAAVVLAVISGTIGYYWIESSRRQRMEKTTRSVNEILSQAELLRDRARTSGHDELVLWSGALEKGREATRLAGTTEVEPDLKERVNSIISELEREEALARKDHEMLLHLEGIRVQAGESWDWNAMDNAYVAAFRSYGVDIEELDIVDAASRIRTSAISRELLGEMDEWTLARDKTGGDRQKLAQITLLADTDEWRNELRQALMQGDKETVRKLAEEWDREELLPVDAHVLSVTLTHANARDTAISVLEAAVRNHPDDFLLNLNLGWTLHWSTGDGRKDAIRYLGCAVALRPESTAALNNLVTALTRDGQIEAARTAIKKSLSLDADNPRTRRCYGVFLYEAVHDYDSAIVELERSVELDPSDAGGYASLGRAWHLKGNLEEAMKQYQRSLELSPDYIDPKGNMALILDGRGNKEEALRLYDEILQLDPDHGQAYFNRGCTFQSQGRLKQASESFRQAVRCHPDKAVWNYSLGCVHFHLQEWNEAERCLLKVVELDKDNSDAHYTLGCTFWRKGDLNRAKQHLLRSLEIAPDYIEASLDLGNVYQEEGKLAKARSRFEKVLEHKPDDERALYNLGKVHLALGDYDVALESYERLISITDDVWAWNDIGWIHKEMGDGEEALKAFQRALALDPGYFLAQYNRAVALMVLREYEEALDAARVVLEATPENRKGEVLTLIGDIHIRRGSLTKAEECLREAMRFDWMADEPRFQLANVLNEQGRYEEAAELFQETLDLNPGHHDAHIDLAYCYQALGQYCDALVSMHRGCELGKIKADWVPPSAHCVEDCETMLEMNVQLDAILEGTVTVDDTESHILLALVCRARGYPMAAARYFHGALSARPELGKDPFQAYWFQAARAALMASSGEGRDNAGLNMEEKNQLRRWALDWLNNDLALWLNIANHENMGNYTFQRALAVRKLHPDLHAVRDPEVLATLPDDVHEDFEEYWAKLEEPLAGNDV